MQTQTDQSPLQTADVALTEGLAAFVVETPAAKIPAEAFEAASRCIVDTIGCILAGANSELLEPLSSYLHAAAEPGLHIVAGTRFRTSAASAAMINGSFGHALDFD